MYYFVLELSRLEEDLLKSPREKLACIINAVIIVISILYWWVELITMCVTKYSNANNSVCRNVVELAVNKHLP